MWSSDPGLVSDEDDRLVRHLRFLESHVFQIHTKWPHYRCLLRDLQEISGQAAASATVACLERAFIFGGKSLFAALFPHVNFCPVDVLLEELPPDRIGYQLHWLEHPDCYASMVAQEAYVSELPFVDGEVDVLLVPNLVHHIRDQSALFAEIARVMKPGGRGFIFETLLRELHQVPFDFVRWTPWGFEEMLGTVGLRLTEWRPAGGPFEAIAYCWDQALQYLPQAERDVRSRWFRTEHFPELMRLEAQFGRCNLEREHTTFPVAYGIHFEKPVSGT